MGSGESIPGGDYDIIFSNFVLHWCKDKDLVFKEVTRTLKHGGMFGFIALADYNAVEQMYTPASMFSPECHRYILEHVHIESYERMLTSLTATNCFSIKYSKKHFHDVVFDDISELVEFHMTHYGRGKFGAEHFNIEVMKQRYGEGIITFTFSYITVVAERTQI